MRPRLPLRSRARFARRCAPLALAAALALGGCRNPFLPVEPELPLPADASIQVPIDFATPEGLLSTISAAVTAKARGNGVTAYMAAFSDSAASGYGLTIDLDPTVVTDRTNAGKVVPSRWTRDLEPAFYNYLSNLNPGDYTLDWTLDPASPDVDDTPDHALRTRFYTSTATAADGYTVTNVARGRAVIEMRLLPGASPSWVIVRWTDYVDPSTGGPDPTDPGLRSFSRLRIDSYNR